MKRIIVGISGASGFPLAVSLLKELQKNPEVETHLIFTRGAAITAGYESDYKPEDIRALADISYGIDEIGAPVASGSFRTDGMVIVPCSVKTVSGIANGYSDNLLLRAADVTIKEQRKLVLAVRETPLSSVHLENMLKLSRIPGVYLLPPMLTYYHKPESIADMERQIVGRLLQPFEVETEDFCRWG